MSKTGKLTRGAEKGARGGKTALLRGAGGVRGGKTALLRGAGALRVSAEAKRQFEAWFRRNFADPRVGAVGRALYLRAGAFDDRPGDGAWYADAYERAVLDHTQPLTPTEDAFLREHPLIGLQLLFGFADVRALRCLRRGLTQGVNALQKKAYRRRYYARDNARRRLLAAERRKIRRRTTLAACPTPEAFRAAFARVGESVEAKILFGGLVHDLECYVDNGLRIDARGEIVGRRGGVKAWIFENAPELCARYKTIMRYKALARRVRQAAGIGDPVPTAAFVAGALGGADASDVPKTLKNAPKDAEKGENPESARDENYYARDSHFARSGEWRRRIERARKRVGEVFGGCPNTMAEAFRRVDEALGDESTGNWLCS